MYEKSREKCRDMLRKFKSRRNAHLRRKKNAGSIQKIVKYCQIEIPEGRLGIGNMDKGLSACVYECLSVSACFGGEGQKCVV